MCIPLLCVCRLTLMTPDLSRNHRLYRSDRLAREDRTARPLHHSERLSSAWASPLRGFGIHGPRTPYPQHSSREVLGYSRQLAHKDIRRE